MSDEALGLVFIGVFAFVVIAVNAFVCLLLHRLAAAVPAGHRKVEPGLVWLLMIPCFNVIWNFFVFLPICKGYRSWADVVRPATDTKENLGLAYCILSVCSFLPYAGACIALAGLVVLIIYLTSMFEVKRILQRTLDSRVFD